MPRDRKRYCVYIMSSFSGTLYIGTTSNLHQRVFEHKFHRIEGFTEKYDIVRLVYWESFDDVSKAINREKQLKGWKRCKKVALIELLNPHWLDLAREWYPWMTPRSASRDGSTPQPDPQAGPPAPLTMTKETGIAQNSITTPSPATTKHSI